MKKINKPTGQKLLRKPFQRQQQVIVFAVCSAAFVVGAALLVIGFLKSSDSEGKSDAKEAAVVLPADLHIRQVLKDTAFTGAGLHYKIAKPLPSAH